MVAVRQEGDELWLDLFIQPKASRDQIQGVHGDELKVAITAPPVDGQAKLYHFGREVSTIVQRTSRNGATVGVLSGNLRMDCFAFAQ
mgnify:CR=1 FL=1